MAEYFDNGQLARDHIKKFWSTDGKPVVFAKVELRGETKWYVEYQRRGIPSSIEIENLNHELDEIAKG